MKALVIYDSFFGNTEQIARAIAAGIGADAALSRPGAVTPEQLRGLDLLVVGSPTRAFRPSPDTQAFLKTLQPGSLKGVNVAAFDTRIPITAKTPAILRVMVRFFGYAAAPIANRLSTVGGALARPAEGFMVNDTEGPLLAGELERARAWGQALKEN